MTDKETLDKKCADAAMKIHELVFQLTGRSLLIGQMEKIIHDEFTKKEKGK